jgi:hypothetical protein
MINAHTLKPIFAVTLKDPRAAAEKVIALRLPTQILWMVLTLISVVTSLIFAALLQATPLPQDEIGRLVQSSPVYDSPLIFALTQWARVVPTAFMLYFVGRALGGQGTLAEILAVITWLQAVSFVLLAGLIFLGLAIPLLSSLGTLVFFGWWLWAMIMFLDAAHDFGNPFKAAGVLVLSVIGVLIGLSIAMGIIAAIFVGIFGAP